MSKKKEKKTHIRKKRKLTVGWCISIIVIAELAVVLGLATGISYFLTNQFAALSELPIAAWVVIVGIVIGTPISIFVNRAVLSPIRRLGEAMQLVAEGNFAIQLNTKAYFGDIENIYRNFNIMTQELAANEILKTDFVSNVSHEIKTPITAIEGYAMLLQGECEPNSEQAEYIEKILINSTRLSELVGNVLLLSKIENQSIEEKYESFLLDEQIRQSILLLEPKWTEKDVELDVELDTVEYRGNKGFMMHVWNNLLGNAIKFTPRSSKVTVRLTATDEKTVFTVDDMGSGISEKAVKHIFDKFYQADNSHRQEGNGLGLSLVKRILDVEGGSIETENLEVGCRFTVILQKK